MSRGNARPPGFVGELDDIGFDWSRRVMRVRALLPYPEFDAFTRRVGLPPSSESRQATALALLPCRTPRHPEREEDVLAEAALSLLEQLVEGGALRITPRLVLRLAALLEAARRQPLHVSTAEPEAQA